MLLLKSHNETNPNLLFYNLGKRSPGTLDDLNEYLADKGYIDIKDGHKVNR